jgi:hypothetical protein
MGMKYDSGWLKEMADRGLIVEVRKANAPVLPQEPLPFVILPKVPSVNNLFLTTRKGKKTIRVKTPEYKQWIKDATPIMERLKVPSKFPVKYKYTILGKLRASADGANLEKAACDLAVACGIIPDDNIQYVVGGSWSYQPERGINGVMFEFEELPD